MESKIFAGESNTAGTESKKWEEALNQAIPAIVVIRVCSVRAFDGEGSGFSTATGFIVDKEKGIVLTNRHVVTPGPVRADAIFLNKEEVDLVPIYRDPVHDFGFYRFDPAKVKFQTLREIPLDPDGAWVGREIRVVGNDAGEKLSILPGVLARLDREAPHYGPNDYNDFNTFYYCAASSTSGGSSGSPVLTLGGRAVALNCGGAKQAASSFYLPVHRIQRALELVQATPAGAAPAVPRGTLQTIFKHTAFDEVKRLGLQEGTEAEVRGARPEETGMLVVDQVVPGGPAAGQLEPGDVLVSLDGQLVTQFRPYEEIVDGAVGRELALRVQRGGQEREVRLTVQDLHAITPAELLEVSGGVVHALSYQQARNYNLPCGGVYMAQSGYMFGRAGITCHCIFVAVGPHPTPDLGAFEEALAQFQDGDRTTVRYFGLRDRHRTRTALVTIDRSWFPAARSVRDDATGLWRVRPCRPPRPAAAATAASGGAGEGEAGAALSSPSESSTAAAAAGAGAGGQRAPPPADGDAAGDSSSASSPRGGGGHPADPAALPPGAAAGAGPLCSGGASDAGSAAGGGPPSMADLSPLPPAPHALLLPPGGGAGAGAAAAVPDEAAAAARAALERGRAAVRAALVLVAFDIPYMADGISCSSYLGVGLVVDRAAGLVAVDRNTVPIALGDVLVTVGGSQEVPGRAVFCHPVHNLALVQIDPAAVDQLPDLQRPGSDIPPAEPVVSDILSGYEPIAEARLAGRRAAPGDCLNFHGLTSSFVPVFQRPIVTKVERIRLRDSKPPQYMTTNAEVIHFDKVASCVGGAFTNDEHEVVAHWFSFAYTEDGERKEIFRGMDSSIVKGVLDQIRESYSPSPTAGPGPPEGALVRGGSGSAAAGAEGGGRAAAAAARAALAALAPRSLGAQLATVELAKVRAGMGLPREWCRRFEDHCPEGRRQLLLVRRRAVFPPEEQERGGLLETGDVLLAVGGLLVHRFPEVEAAAQAERVAVTVLRREQVITLDAPTLALPPIGTRRLLMWSGVMLQAPHQPVLNLGYVPEGGGGVYASRWCYGSPAHKYGLRATVWVVEVNGTPTPTLDAFLAAVAALDHGTAVRLRTVDLNTKVKVFTLKTDYHYWPTLEVVRDDATGRWLHRKHSVPSPNPAAHEEPPLAAEEEDAAPTAAAMTTATVEEGQQPAASRREGERCG